MANYLISATAAINARTNTSIADQAFMTSAVTNIFFCYLMVIGNIHSNASTKRKIKGTPIEKPKYTN